MRERDARRVQLDGALVFAALVFDVLDGRVARWRQTSSTVGREFDSLADVRLAGFDLHPLVLVFALSGSLMVSRIRIPKY